MRVRTPLLIVAVVAGTATTALAAAPGKLAGTVGPGFTIALASKGAPVKTVKAGSFTITVNDKSSIHDFHLIGPGVNKVITSVAGTGTKSVTLTLKKGTYKFVCDPHASSMKGSFKVT